MFHSTSRGQLHVNLMSRNPSYQEEEFRKQMMIQEYDPFKSPPNFDLVNMHAKACLVGKFDNDTDPILCPCCSNFVNKAKININCGDKDLEFLGSAYPLFFRMTIYVIILILLLFFFGGSLRIFISNLQCETNCVRFFDLFVIMDQSKEKEQFDRVWYDILTAFLLMVAVLIIKPKIASNIEDFNLGFLDPASYTIVMKNLPQNTKKEDIENFLAPILKKGKKDKKEKKDKKDKKYDKDRNDQEDKIEKINFVYSVDKYYAAFNQKIKYIKEKNIVKLKIKDSFQDQKNLPKLNNELLLIEDKLKEQEEMLEKFSRECQAEGNNENFTGTAFVTFNNQKILNPILNEWGNNFRRSLQHFFVGWYYKPYSPYQDFKGNPLIITKAPTPTDILWDNQKFSFFRTYSNNSLMILIAIGILFASFYLQYILMQIVYPFRKNANQDFVKRIQAYLMSFVVVIVNTILRLVVMHFTYLQKPDSQVRFNRNYVNRYVVLLFLNSAFMPYLIHKRWDDDIQVSSNLLLQDITFLFVTNAFSEPFAKIFNVFWLQRIYVRKYYIRGYEEKDCPYTQHEAHYWYEGPTFNIANSYAYIARTLFLCTWYASVSPYGLLSSLLGLIFNYYVDRVLLLRYCSCPETQNEDVFKEVIASLPLLPIIYVCGVIQFQNRTKLEVNENLFVFIGQYFEYGLTLIAIFVSFVSFLILNKQDQNENYQFNQKFNISYQDATDEFRTEYEKANPITSYKSNMEWTKSFNKKRANQTIGNQLVTAQNRNSRLTNAGFQFGGVRNSTLMQRNSSVTSFLAFKQRIPDDHQHHGLPLTSSQKNFEMISWN